MSNEKDEDLEVINLDEYEEDYDNEEDYDEEDYDDDEYEDEEDYDYDDLALAEDDSDSNFIFKEKDSENDEKWGFQDEEYEDENEEYYDDEEDEYEDEYDEYDEDYDDEDEDDEDVEYIDDDFIEEPEYDDEEPLDSQEIAPTKPVAATEDSSGVVDSKSKSNPLNGDMGEDEEDLEADEEKDGDGEPIFEKLFGAIKDKNISIDLSFYDKAMSTVLTKLSALPVVGKLFALFTKSKNVLRLFPLILIVLIYGICFVFSMITGVDKTSTVELPDSGEVTLTTVDFYKDTNNIIFEAENTGGVINPFEVEEMKLYTYSPGLNPLSWAKFKEIGTCSLPENSVEDIAELSGKCELKEGEKAAFNTRAVIESEE